MIAQSTDRPGMLEERPVRPPEITVIAMTRVMLGAGLGLLAADAIRPQCRRAVGWTLLGVGALTTIPLAMHVLTKPRATQDDRH